MVRTAAAFVLALAAQGCFADGESVAPVLGSADDSTGAPGTSGTDDSGGVDAGSTSTDDGVDAESGPGTTASADDTTAGPVTCAGMDQCLPAAPAMWSGPHVVAQAPGAAMPPMCPGTSNPIRLGGEPPLDAPPAACDCNPGEPACAVALQAIDADTKDCKDVADFALLTPQNTICNQIEIRGVAFGLNGTDGECSATELGVTTSEPVWAARYGICELDDPVSCGDGVCAPPPDANRRACVVRDGIHDCAPGPYSERVVVFDSVDDQRDCTACVTEPDCGQVDFYDDPECGSASFFAWPVATPGPVCEPSPVTLDVEFESVQWSGELACEIIEAPMPTGQAMPADPFTVCCLEP